MVALTTCGKIIIPIDADLQNDPHDINKLYKRINDDLMLFQWRKI